MNNPVKYMHAWFNALQKYELSEVTEAFDTWLKNQTQLATIADMLKLCKPKVTIYARIASPLAVESYKQHAANITTYVKENIKPQLDCRACVNKESKVKYMFAAQTHHEDVSLLVKNIDIYVQSERVYAFCSELGIHFKAAVR